MTSQFDRQAQASLDQIDLEAAQARVEGILHKGPQAVAKKQTDFNPQEFELEKAHQEEVAGVVRNHVAQAEAAAEKKRKKRSDAGVPKTPADEITLKLHFDVARDLAKKIAGEMPTLAALIQDQIIQNLLRRVQAK